MANFMTMISHSFCGNVGYVVHHHCLLCLHCKYLPVDSSPLLNTYYNNLADKSQVVATAIMSQRELYGHYMSVCTSCVLSLGEVNLCIKLCVNMWV